MKADIFAPGEYDEFRREDYASAAAVYEKLVSSADDATRISALVRLGRVLRKANDPVLLDAFCLLFDGNLQDGFVDFSAAYQWSVGILWEEDDE